MAYAMGMSKRERIPHAARFLMTFHAAADRAGITNFPADNVAPAFVPSVAQRALLNRLMDELSGLDAAAHSSAAAYTAKMDEAQAWTPGKTGNLSRWIDRLIAKVNALRTERRNARPVEIEDGMYLFGGEVYKVVHAVHGSGRQYAKLLVTAEIKDERAGWAMAPGVVSKLRPEHRMTLEQAREYGRMYGICCNCGAVLTDEDSIAAGIGPVCAGKF